MSNSIRVLQVEDSEDDALLAIRELEGGGFTLTSERVETAKAMAIALDSQEWDIVIADYSLPHFNGVEALKLLQQRGLDLLFIIVSGAIGEDVAVEAMKAGAHDYIMKGNLQRLVPAVERELREAQGRRERKQAEERLRESEQRYRAVVQTAGDAIIAANHLGKITLWNDGAKDIFGYTAEEVVGKPLTIIIPEQFREGHLQAFNRATRTGKVKIVGSPIEVVGLRKDGSELPLEISRATWKEGDTVSFIAIIRDITERKQADEALIETNSRLEKALAELQRAQGHMVRQERLSALGEMASGIAHDFNNALMPILGFSELLLAHPKDLENKERVMDYLQTINTAARDAASVVSRMREFYRTREEVESYAQIDLSDLVAQSITLTQPKWREQAQAKGISIRIEVEIKDAPPIFGQESELRQMLVNLILNSIEAMPNGGTITLRATPADKQVLLEISDTGIGMTEEVLQRCFEPFFTTKGPQGTGLGLSMVYGIMQRHDATIEIESEYGKGTRFTIGLPVWTAKRTKGKSRTDAPSRSLHVLVVDDEPLTLQVLTGYLTADGHTVETAANGYQALEKFHQGGEHFDLVLTDLSMSEMSGDQLAAAIETVKPTPLILLTGFGAQLKVARENPVGVDIILTKPVSLAELRLAIEQVMTMELPSEGNVIGNTDPA